MKIGLRLSLAALASGIACSSSTTAQTPAPSLFVSSDVTTIKNDGTKANVTVTAKDASAKAGTGTVTLTSAYGDLNGTGKSTATVTLDGNGAATATFACNAASDAHCVAGGVAVTATWSGVSNGVTIAITTPAAPGGGGGGGTDGGTDGGTTGGGDGGTKVAGPPAIIMETTAVPEPLGLKGSGIQENGLMTFLVTDAEGTPAPGAAVTFSQASPNLVTLGHTSGTSGADGTVTVDYAAGPEVGVSSITATLTANGASSSHAVAVRGARPSASGFYFRCNKLNLPVYTTTLEYETTVCTVRLKDRFGNRVGIPTPVSFATEAGAISAVATTKAFDITKSDDPEEGTVSVTFSSDLGNGFRPVATAPFAADASQFPKPRALEPSAGTNCTTTSSTCRNPRDQLVTMIAMVRGEEAFVDANHNGKYDTGELFVDQGDPFIDANDNNAYDSATETRFCGGSDCSAYQGPNGVWDPDRTLWVPNWVVFTGPAGATTDPWTAGGCADYTDNDAANPAVISTVVKFQDAWLNSPPVGTTETASLTTKAPTGLTLNTSGGFAELDNLGSMDPSWERVSAADNTKDCTVANTVNGVCVMKTEFGQWDSGYRLGLQIVNANKLPPAAAGVGHACPTPSSSKVNNAPFSVDIVTAEPTVSVHSSTGGTFGY